MTSFTDVPFTIELFAEEGSAEPDLTGAHDIFTIKSVKPGGTS